MLSVEGMVVVMDGEDEGAREDVVAAVAGWSVENPGFWNPPHTYSPPFLPPVAGEQGWDLGDPEYEASLVAFNPVQRFRGVRKGVRP